MPNYSELTIAERIQASESALSLAELANLLGCSKSKLYTLIDNNRIPYMRLGSMIRFDPKITADWVRSKSSIVVNGRAR